MEVLGVAYHWTPARQAQWQRWADRLGARLTLLHTHPDRADQPTYVGNTHFEFTAYAAAARHAQTDGPYVVVNDTLLDRHATTLWANWLLVSSYLFNNSGPWPRWSRVTRNEKPTSGVYCDVYPAPRERPVEIPDPYASSWIFYLPTRADLETLSAAVQQVVSQPAAEPSPAYQAFLDRWLNHPVPGVGYQGPRTPEDLARKRQTIMWEHALSQVLVTSNQLQPFKGTRYRILRFIDKVLRRIQLLARPAKQETRNRWLLETSNQKPMVTRNQQPETGGYQKPATEPMSWYRKVLAVLLFLPNITLGTNTPGLGRPEIFPWASLFVVRRDLRLTLGYLLFAGYLGLSFAVHTARGGDFLAGFRSLLALVNASVAFFAIIRVRDDEFRVLNWAFIGVFAANILVSMMQNFGLFPEQLVRPMRFFIERFEATPMGYGRGVGGLFAEPSYLALGIHHYFAYAMLLFRVEQKKTFGLILTAAMALYDILIIRSATGFTIMVIYFLSHQNWRTAWKGMLFLGVTGATVLYFAGEVAELPRSLDIAYNVLYRQNADDIFTYITYEGGIRIVSLLSCYPFGIAHPLGWGIGSWPQASISAMLEVGLSEIEVAFFENYSPYDGFRPTAYSADLFLEAGIVGWALFALALAPYVTQKAMWRDPNTRAIVVIFLFNMLILGTIGDPLPFVFLALAYRSINPPPDEPIPSERN